MPKQQYDKIKKKTRTSCLLQKKRWGLDWNWICVGVIIDVVVVARIIPDDNAVVVVDCYC